MDEYISREAVLKAFKLIAKNPNKDYQRGMQDTIDCLVPEVIADIPAADVQPAKQWISVNDRLPEAVEEDVNGKIAFSKSVLVYLVYDNGFTYITNDRCRVDSKSWLHEIPGEGCKVTHWMPLPEPPKDGNTK